MPLLRGKEEVYPSPSSDPLKKPRNLFTRNTTISFSTTLLHGVRYTRTHKLMFVFGFLFPRCEYIHFFVLRKITHFKPQTERSVTKIYFIRNCDPHGSNFCQWQMFLFTSVSATFPAKCRKSPQYRLVYVPLHALSLRFRHYSITAHYIHSLISSPAPSNHSSVTRKRYVPLQDEQRWRKTWGVSPNTSDQQATTE
jgi:hypothetical protein